jgi:hypothetical protein
MTISFALPSALTSETSSFTSKRPRRCSHKVQSDTKGFYHLAAALAHHDAEPLATSNLLESDYQDCLLSFSANGKRFSKSFNKSQVSQALNKFLLAYDNKIVEKISYNFNTNLLSLIDYPEQACIRMLQKFTTDEIAIVALWALSSWDNSSNKLLSHSLSAFNFHDELTNITKPARKRAFWLNAYLRQENLDLLITKASLYSAHRLSKKSLQIDNGVSAGIRYYHAALYAENLAKNIDILYWLQFDENHQIIQGEFINTTLPKYIRCPLTEINKWVKNHNSVEKKLRQDIIDMYLASLGVI